MNCQKMDLIESLRTSFFKVRKVNKRSNLAIFYTFGQFSQKRYDNFSLFLAYSFLGMILINCQEMDLIELFKRSFSR